MVLIFYFAYIESTLIDFLNQQGFSFEDPFDLEGVLGTNGGNVGSSFDVVLSTGDSRFIGKSFGTKGETDEYSFRNLFDAMRVLNTNGGNVGSSYDIVLDTKDHEVELILVGVFSTKNGDMGLVGIGVFGMNGG